MTRRVYKLKTAIAANNREAIDALLKRLMGKAGDVAKKEVEDSLKFLDGWWEMVVPTYQKESGGSRTEAQVQHTSACRMSSVPHGRSRKILEKLLALRVALLNGHTAQAAGYERSVHRLRHGARHVRRRTVQHAL